MKVLLPLMVLDQFEAAQTDESPVERFEWNSDKDFVDEVFLDGPVTSRVAILDFDERTGALHAPIELGGTAKRSRYIVPDGATGNADLDADDRGFQAVSVLGGVLHALHLFEAADVLGRRIEWAFDSKQLLVIPRAGTWKNAYYERATSSLQFFSFAGDELVPRVHTSLSLDIVSHETGHAILDAIAPYLYDCVTPQSLALHEAVGDLTALFASLNRSKLRDRLLTAGNGDIKGNNAYTRVAPAFGHYRSGDDSLRSMWNDKKLDAIANPNDTHALSEVLTGMIYELLVWAFDREVIKREAGVNTSKTRAALASASGLTRRVALRGLDYLPPGEVSFADYVRSAIAADAVANPDNPECRDELISLAAKRKIGTKRSLRFVKPRLKSLEPKIDIDELVRSEWHAYQFVEEHRQVFKVPDDIGFLIEPRLLVEKTAYRDGGSETYREMIMKISWEALETNGRRRWVRFGTTVAFDRDTGSITALVTTNPALTNDGQSEARRAMVDELIDEGFLEDDLGESIDHSSGLRLRGTGRTLHAARVGDGPAVDVEAELAEMNKLVEGPTS